MPTATITHIPLGGKVTEPGFYMMPAATYHRDPCPEPSLSNSIAKLLVYKSPEHGFHNHPRLNVGHRNGGDAQRIAEIGSVAHKLLLGAGAEIVEIPFADYYKGDAKDARANAYAAGNLPILQPDLERCYEMAAVARKRFPAMH